MRAAVGLLYAWMLAGMMACHAQTPPQPDVIPGGLPTITVYEEIVDAGCLAPDDSGEGLASVAVMHLDGGTPWLECLFQGGSTASCAVPCGASGKR